jgi:hypothetical protein
MAAEAAMLPFVGYTMALAFGFDVNLGLVPQNHANAVKMIFGGAVVWFTFFGLILLGTLSGCLLHYLTDKSGVVCIACFAVIFLWLAQWLVFGGFLSLGPDV